MSSLALYRKYRSGSFDDVVGQEHITQSLKNAVENNRISHAYLFTGPRGVGKTSIARILAHEINDIEYNPLESSHLDIIEIDAASNNSVEDIRDLREKIHSAPTEASYKVYIIDEVHMLSNSAFNALLKTLEEPPSHAVFVMATTEAHKLPDTIISRTQRYTFHPIDFTKIQQHLKVIAKEEGVDVEDDALQLIAEKGEGSLRDSISLLDQVVNLYQDKVTREKVESMLGMVERDVIIEITEALADKDSEKLFKHLREFNDIGINAVQVSNQLIDLWRQIALVQNKAITTEDKDILRLVDKTLHNILLDGIDNLLEVAKSRDEQITFELAILKLLHKSRPASSEDAPQFASKTKVRRRKKNAESKEQKTENREQEAKSTEQKEDSKEQKTKNKKQKTVNKEKEVEENAQKSKAQETEESQSGKSGQISKEEWLKIIFAVKEKSNQLYTVLRLGQMEFDGGNTITVRFRFPFHRRRVEEAGNKELIQEKITEITGQAYKLKCEVAGINHDQKDKNESDKEPSEDAKKILNVFGGGEVINE